MRSIGILIGIVALLPLSLSAGEKQTKSEYTEFSRLIHSVAVKQLPKDKVIYCHCRAGGRALLAADILKKLGYDVRPMKEGYEDLLKAGFIKSDK